MNVTDSTEPSVALAIPDPRHMPIPQGWATEIFALEAASLNWGELKEAEGRLMGIASYIESLGGDRTELEKALRIVEYHKVQVLGATRQGGRTDLQPFPRAEEVDASPATVSRWRDIARNWDETIWPHLLQAKEAREVSQSACLRVIEARKKDEAKASTTEAANTSAKNGKARKNSDTQTTSSKDSAEEEEDADNAAELLSELEQASNRIQWLQAENESLVASDSGAEIRKWSAKYASLDGRLQQAIAEGNEAKRKVKHQATILEQLRKLLSVETNSDLVGAVKDLLR